MKLCRFPRILQTFINGGAFFRLNEGFVHQNVNVPGPFTVVCKVDVLREYTIPLSAAETPSRVVLVSEYHPP